LSARWRAWAGGIAAVALCGCVVGPKYRRHDPPVPSAWREAAARPDQAPLSRTTSDEADLSRWWRAFNDPELDRLIARALDGNLDLQAAGSRIRQARQQEIVEAAAGLPTLGANPQISRTHISKNSIPPALLNLFGGGGGGGASAAPGSNVFGQPGTNIPEYQVGFDATWEIDLFGGIRRSVEAARAQTAAQVWNRRDSEVSLTAEVASDYLAYRGLQRRAAIVQEEIARQQQNLQILVDQARGGLVPSVNVSQQRTQLETTTAQLPPLQAEMRAEVHALGVLLGLPPQALSDELAAAAPLPAPPPVVAAGLPADLLRRRPDIRAAERQLAGANAEIGVAIAQLYPQLNLNASADFVSTTITHLFDLNSRQTLIGGALTAPLFEGGRLRANVRSAREQHAQAVLQYQSVLLGALRDVEDALSRCAAEQRREASLKRSVEASQAALRAAQAQYQGGQVTYINVLTAEQSLLSAQDQLAQSDVQLDQDLASLFKALGGGWQADDPADQLRR
jgi:NodT family efflux transporter outer membrane factor (OMF) lipoprotein